MELKSSENNWSPVQVCVLSASAIAPILSPILDNNLGCEKVVVIVTQDNIKRFDHLQKVLKTYQVRAEKFVVSSAFDIESLRVELSELMTSLIDERPLVNVTVGSKPLAIVLHEQATSLEFPVFYLNTNDQLNWFWPRHQPTLALDDVVKCEPFLMAHGIEVVSAKTPQMRPELVDFFKEQLTGLEGFDLLIRDLNRLAFQGKSNYQAVLSNADLENEALQQFLNGLQQHGCIEFNGQCVDFIDEESHFFANGGWLENWVHVHLNRLKKQLPALQHHLASVELRYGTSAIKNEIDNLVLYNNNLYLIECKTVRFKSGSKPASDVIYKLDTLQKQLGGALGKGLLVSFYEITEREQQRAKEYGIKVIHGQQLFHLQKHLADWFTEQR